MNRQKRIDLVEYRLDIMSTWVIGSLVISGMIIVGATCLPQPYTGIVGIFGAVIGLVGMIASELIIRKKYKSSNIQSQVSNV